MNKSEYLLTCLIEECAEVTKDACKALRFGLTDTDPKDGQYNCVKIAAELVDVVAIVELLQESGALDPVEDIRAAIDRKKARVATFMAYSKSVGALHDPRLAI